MIPDDFQKIMIFMIFIMFDLEESASHPLPLLEGVPQVKLISCIWLEHQE